MKALTILYIVIFAASDIIFAFKINSAIAPLASVVVVTAFVNSNAKTVVIEGSSYGTCAR